MIKATGASQELHDLLLGEVMPFMVGISHREEEAPSYIEADDFIDLSRNELDGTLGRCGNSYGNPARVSLLNEVNRCHHGIARGQTIVHHDDNLSTEIGKGTTTPKYRVPMLDFLYYRDAEVSNLLLCEA